MKHRYFQKIAIRKILSAGGPTASKCFWKYMPTSKPIQSTNITTLEDGGETYTKTEDIQRVITNHFSKKFKTQPTPAPKKSLEEKLQETHIPTEFLKGRKLTEKDSYKLSTQFTMTELQITIASLKEDKAKGLDEITPAMLKHMDETAKDELLTIYNDIWTTGIIPSDWKAGNVKLILK